MIVDAVLSPVGKRNGGLSGIHPVDRQCGSSQQAVHLAAAGVVVAGHYDIAVAGGVESMSRVIMDATRADGLHGEPYGPMVRER